MNCVFNTVTKKFTGTAIRWDMPEITADEIIIVLPDVPDSSARLNAANQVIPATTAERAADAAEIKDTQVDAEFTPALIAIVTAMNPANATAIINQAKAARKDQL